MVVAKCFCCLQFLIRGILAFSLPLSLSRARFYQVFSAVNRCEPLLRFCAVRFCRFLLGCRRSLGLSPPEGRHSLSLGILALDWGVCLALANSLAVVGLC